MPSSLTSRRVLGSPMVLVAQAPTISVTRGGLWNRSSNAMALFSCKVTHARMPKQTDGNVLGLQVLRRRRTRPEDAHPLVDQLLFVAVLGREIDRACGICDAMVEVDDADRALGIDQVWLAPSTRHSGSPSLATRSLLPSGLKVSMSGPTPTGSSLR